MQTSSGRRSCETPDECYYYIMKYTSASLVELYKNLDDCKYLRVLVRVEEYWRNGLGYHHMSDPFKWMVKETEDGDEEEE